MVTIDDIKAFLDKEGYAYKYYGADDIKIEGYCQLSSLHDNYITWAKSKEILGGMIFEGYHSILLIISEKSNELPHHFNQLICDNPKSVFFSILKLFFVNEEAHTISPYALIETESIGQNVAIGHYTFIQKDVVIEDDVKIGHNVSIECPALIGKGSTIGSGTIIGTDGYGYYKDINGNQRKAPHTGGVIIGEYVDVGANACIARGTIGNTIIEDCVKIDNLCHIAHNVHIKKHSMVVALSLLGGSCILEENAYIAPGATVMNQKTIGKNSLVGMGAVVINDVPECKVVAGVPAKIIRDNK